MLLTVAGCSDAPEPVPAPSLDAPVGTPTYEEGLEAAAAVLPFVPATATDLAVTDLERVRLDLEAGELTGSSPQRERDRFWRRAEATAPVLITPLLRGVDAELSDGYGWTMDDVDWQADFGGPEGVGWVLKIRDDLPMGDITRAVEAGVGPLAGAVVRAEYHLVMKGGTDDGGSSWAADPDLVALVGPAAPAVFVSRSCVRPSVIFGPDAEPAPAVAADLADLEPLGAYSVIIGTRLGAARLGQARPDTFDRLRLADTLPETDPDFSAVFTRGAADPIGGRLGWQVTDAAAAADLVVAKKLPFAVCPR